ncbi:MAG: polymerase subunit sigma-70, partial [Devosia sp.]|nr:polymerase subunit sigma-70 [Devosia sp.]
MTQLYDTGVVEAPPDADETLIARAVGGDRRAFAELCERHYDFIFRTAC